MANEPSTLTANGMGNMDKIALIRFLITATSLEAFGDAVVRMGIAQN